MRVAFVTFDFPPFTESSGSGVYAEHVVNELARLGHRISVYVPKADDQPLEHKNANVDIHAVAINKNVPSTALQFWARLPRAIANDKNRPNLDIVHFNGLCYWFARKKVLRIPHVMTVHHLVKEAKQRTKPYNRLLGLNLHSENAFILPYIERRAIKSVDKMIAVSNYTKESIIRHHSVVPSEIDVIYSGAELDHTGDLQPLKAQAKQEYDLPDKPLILFAGRINDPRKGLDILVKAFKVVSEHFDAALIVAGSGSAQKARQLIDRLDLEEEVILTGFVPDDTLKALYAVCDVFVSSSRLEGFGLTVLEAMAWGMPIVATRVGAVPELVEDGINGFLIEPEDVFGLAGGIGTLLDNPSVAARMGRTNRKRAQRFTWSDNARQVERTYRNLLAAP